MLTMRNGLNTYPLGLPRVLQQNELPQQKMGLCEGNGFTNAKVAGNLQVNQDTLLNAILNPAENCTETKLTPVTTISNTNHSDNAFEPESSMNIHLDPFQLSRSTSKVCRIHDVFERLFWKCRLRNLYLHPFDIHILFVKEIWMEDCLHLYGMNEQTTKTASIGRLFAWHPYLIGNFCLVSWSPYHFLFHCIIGANVAFSVPFDTDASSLKRNSWEACLLRCQFGTVNETYLDTDQLLSPQLYR